MVAGLWRRQTSAVEGDCGLCGRSTDETDRRGSFAHAACVRSVVDTVARESRPYTDNARRRVA